MRRFVVLALCGLMSVLWFAATSEAACMRYDDLTLIPNGWNHGPRCPLPIREGPDFHDVAVDGLPDDFIAPTRLPQPPGCNQRPASLLSFMRVTNENPQAFAVAFIAPIACYRGTVVSSRQEVNQLYLEQLDRMLTRDGFHGGLAAFAYQQCTSPATGAAVNTANCQSLRTEIQGKGPTVGNILQAITDRNTALSAFP